jgi:phosphoribosylamine--glycine ligase
LKILVIGNGAREHALVWKIAQSQRVKEIFALPGNAGTAGIAHNINISVSDITSIVNKAAQLKAELVVVGPEAPLAARLVDRLEAAGIPVFGPLQKAAQLESSKVFARDLMNKKGIPCASGQCFITCTEAAQYLQSQAVPVVIKADGLAAGKGVIIATTTNEAVSALNSMMQDKIFGAAGERVIIEECLVGKEVSLLSFSDGKTAIPMVPACDYKRVFDGDKGPNTGGMGSYSPPGFFGKEMIRQVLESVIRPTIAAMKEAGTPYKGVLYTGLILTERGPVVLEFNARFGDPETQAILPRLKTDLVDIMLAVVNGNLDKIKIEWDSNPCVGVVMASGGYPGEYRTGFPITVSDKIDKDINIFYAGAKMQDGGHIVTDGGRVLTVTATGRNMKDARDKVYRNIKHVNFEGCHYRKDIAASEVS